jgi:hypothetical protein
LINLVSIRDQKIASGGLHDHGVGFKTSWRHMSEHPRFKICNNGWYS